MPSFNSYIVSGFWVSRLTQNVHNKIAYRVQQTRWKLQFILYRPSELYKKVPRCSKKDQFLFSDRWSCSYWKCIKMWRSLGIIAVAVVLTIRTSSVTKSSSESADYFSNFELDDDVELEGQKIAEGVKPNSTFGKDYALMSVSFVNKLQICGGSLIREEWILTSATCLSE